VQADINLEASHARSDVALREVPRGGESSEQARGPALGWLRRRRALPAAAAAAIGAHVFGREEKKSGSVEPQAMVCPSPQRPTGSGTIRNIAPGRHAELTKSSRHAPRLV